MGALERGLCEDNALQILEEAENLFICPCDELKSMCDEFLERNKTFMGRRGLL